MGERYVTVHEGQDGQHYWRRVAGNGEVVADGAEGYTTQDDAVEAAIRENPDLEVRNAEGNVLRELL